MCIELISVRCVTSNVNNLTMATRTNPYNNVEVELTEKDPFVSVKTGKESQAKDLQILRSQFIPARGEL